MDQFGFGNLQGLFEIVDDPYILQSLKNKYQKPELEAIKSSSYDELHIKKLDRVKLKTNMFIKLAGSKNTTDFTILQVEIEL